MNRPDRYLLRGIAVAPLFGGVIVGLFGVLWTVLAFKLTEDAPFPFVHFIFPAFGVLFTIAGVGGAIMAALGIGAVGRRIEREADRVDVDPPPAAPDQPGPPRAARAGVCSQCGARLLPGATACSYCGAAVTQ